MTALSIVTATYNRAAKLERNINSVLTQDCHDIEHIIIDNLSDDGTDQLVTHYQQMAPYRVIYVRERDSGMYQAINKGIRRATGEWIHILNSDDVYSSDRSVGMMTRKEHAKFDIVCGAVLLTDNQTGKTICLRPAYHEKLSHCDFPHPGTIIKKSFYETHGYYDERFKMVSDSIFNAQHYMKASYLILDEVLVLMEAGGLSYQFTVRNVCEYFYYLFLYPRFPLGHKLRLAKGYLAHLWYLERQKRQRMSE
jgi:glycosyltransferase involved in cell wall biosynthesis